MRKKRAVGMFLVFALIVSAIGITAASASNYTEEIEQDFTQQYTYEKANGAIVLEYTPAKAEAWTRISVSADATAYSYVALKSDSGNIFTSYGRSASRRYVDSGHAVGDSDYAKEVIHSGYRYMNDITMFWSYRVRSAQDKTN